MNGLSRRRAQGVDLRGAPSISPRGQDPIFHAPRLAANGIGASRTQVPGYAAPEAAP